MPPTKILSLANLAHACLMAPQKSDDVKIHLRNSPWTLLLTVYTSFRANLFYPDSHLKAALAQTTTC